jgi:hypothetical protein
MTTKPKTKKTKAPGAAGSHTLPELAKTLGTLGADLFELKAKLEALADQTDAQIAAGDKTLVDHGNRLNAFSNRIAALESAIAVHGSDAIKAPTDTAAANATTREALRSEIRELVRDIVQDEVGEHRRRCRGK